MHTHGLNSLLAQRYASGPDVSELQTHISACLVETSTWTRLKPVQMELSIFHLPKNQAAPPVPVLRKLWLSPASYNPLALPVPLLLSSSTASFTWLP